MREEDDEKMKRSAAVFFCVMMILGLLTGAAPAAGEEEKQTLVDVISEYTSMDLGPYEGKALFITFFTEWCPYCMQEMEHIKKIYDTYDREELALLLVHVWDREDASNTESVKQRFGMQDFTFFEDERMELIRVLRVPGYPFSFFINKEGALVNVASAMSYEEMAAAVESMGVTKASAEEAAQ